MRRTIVLLAVFGAVAAFCLPAAASINVGDTYQIDHHPSPGQSQGGPFEFIRTSSPVVGEPLGVNPSDPLLQKTLPSTWNDAYFWSFCVEIGEFFSPGNTYPVFAIADATYKTGRDLSGYNAWIYTMFRDADGWHLPSAILSGGITGAEYNLLQNAAWAGMVGDSGVVGGGGSEDDRAELVISDWTPYEALGIGYDDFLASTWGGGVPEEQALAYLGRVKVLNMGPLGLAQDHLGLVSGQTLPPPLPEPSTLIIWSLLGAASWLGMRIYRRGRRVGRQPWSDENRTAILGIIDRNRA